MHCTPSKLRQGEAEALLEVTAGAESNMIGTSDGQEDEKFCRSRRDRVFKADR